jgi:hypothetical protein
MQTRRFHLVGLITLALAMAPAWAAAADRGARPQTRPAPQRWESKHVEHRRTDNGHQHNTTWTGKDGKTATREATVARDKEAGTRTRDVTYTGPDGATRTVNDVTTRTDDGYTRATTTGPQGNTTTRTVVGSYDEESDTWTRDITVDRDRGED